MLFLAGLSLSLSQFFFFPGGFQVFVPGNVTSFIHSYYHSVKGRDYASGKEKSKVKSQRSKVKGQRLKVKGQKSKVKS